MVKRFHFWMCLKEIGSLSPEDVCTSTFTVVCVVYGAEDTEAAWVSISRWMDGEDVVCVCGGILFSHKGRKVLPFAMTLVDHEGIVLGDRKSVV